LRVILSDASYEVIPTLTLAEAQDAASREPPDAAVVDLMLPDGSGLDLCKELRSENRMPIIVLSVLDEEEQKVRALRAGADDYITKPFAARELLARLTAIFRRLTPDTEAAPLIVNGLEINFAAHRVLYNGRDVNLTPTEFELLCLLARNRDRTIASRALLTRIWGADHAHDTPLLRTHIANLRRKIEDHPSQRRHIRTQPGVGYRFCD